MCPLFFFNDTATTEIYTLSLHDALPIFLRYLVYFVENKDRVTCSRFLNTFDDSARHGTDIGTAMASYFGLVVQTTQRYAYVLALQCLGNTFTQAGFTHARRAIKANDWRLEVTSQA